MDAPLFQFSGVDVSTKHLIAAGAVVASSVIALTGNNPTPTPLPPADPATHSVYKKGGAQFTTDATQEMLRPKGGAGLADRTFKTVPVSFKTVVARHGDKVGLRQETLDAQGQSLSPMVWKEWTFQEYYDGCVAVSKALMSDAIGFEQFDSVAITGFNSPEWFKASFGAMIAGGKSAGMYTTNIAEANRYIIEHCDAKVVFCDEKTQLDKILEVRDSLPNLKAIVCWGDFKPVRGARGGCPVMSWDDFIALGAGTSDADVDAMGAKIKPGHCCALIYTSGTTGNPKAVMISHDNIQFESASAGEAIKRDVPSLGLGQERVISFLPLSHVAGMMVDMILPLAICENYGGYVTVSFAKPSALKGTLKDTLVAVKPTLFLGVPRVWEKVAEGVRAVGKANKGAKKAIGDWAKATGKAAAAERQLVVNQSDGSGAARDGAAGTGYVPWGYSLAKVVVFNAIRKKLGLEHCKYAFTGAAPITVDILSYFGSLGITVNEVYGMSECTGATSWSTPGVHVWGSCGFSLPGCEMKIIHDAERGDKPGNGELCFRGRHIMMGYMANPKLGKEHVETIEKKNREAIDDEGWLHSGDLGRVDDHGMYYITGRLKELIIGAGGENIAPVPIEDHIKLTCPGLSNVMMIGDKRKYNTALVTVKLQPDTAGDGFTNKLFGDAKDVNQAVTTADEACKDKKWFEYVLAGIKDYNTVASSNAQKIQYFVILDRDFSVPGGELTGTLKLKRNTVVEHFEDEIESMYDGRRKKEFAAFMK